MTMDELFDQLDGGLADIIPSGSTDSTTAAAVLPNDSGKVLASQTATSSTDSGVQPFIPCRVCGDKASGYHYGVTSCEGCKGFFRRSIQKQIEYRCLRDGKCMVVRLNRNRCQYCRFKKCLAVGMSRDSVRYGRVPKRIKCLEEQVVSTTEQTLEEKRQLAIYDVILAISQAHHANCNVTEDKLKALQKIPKDLCEIKFVLDDLDPSLMPAVLEAQKLTMWQTFAVLTTPTIQQIVEFSKRVPGFSELSQDDQLILIKTGFFEMWVIRVARMVNTSNSTIIFCDGSIVSREQLEIVFSSDLVQGIFNYSDTFNHLRLSDTEIGLFSSISLLTPDRKGVTNPQLVEAAQDKIIEAIKLQLSRNHSSEPQLFANLLIKLPELRSLGARHHGLLQYYQHNWAQTKLPPLFAEIFDIPKNTTEDEDIERVQT